MTGQDLIFPLRRPDPYTPPPQYRSPDGSQLRRCSLAYGGEAWLVTGLRAAREILADTISFSSDSTRPEFPAYPLASKRPIPGHFLSMDPPDHTRLRRLVADEFSGGRVKRMHSSISATAAGLVDTLVAGNSPADLVEAVALPLPGITASKMLGTPAETRDFFVGQVRRMQRHDATTAQRVAAAGRLHQYLEQLILAKLRNPGEDVLSRLARALDEGEVALPEAVGMANLIVVAGLETTAGLLSLAVLSLLMHEEQGDLVRSDPHRWAGPAVDEALRYWTVVQHGVVRVATRETEVAGCTIRKGDGLVISLPAANRDAAVYREPDRFDITRDVRGQLAFGHGAHRCLGSFVAQAQAQLAVAELFRRLPGLRLGVPAMELSFLDDMLIYGLRALPVTW
jgi:cytochrome P450 monooxygenase